MRSSSRVVRRCQLSRRYHLLPDMNNIVSGMTSMQRPPIYISLFIIVVTDDYRLAISLQPSLRLATMPRRIYNGSFGNVLRGIFYAGDDALACHDKISRDVRRSLPHHRGLRVIIDLLFLSHYSAYYDRKPFIFAGIRYAWQYRHLEMPPRFERFDIVSSRTFRPSLLYFYIKAIPFGVSF